MAWRRDRAGASPEGWFKIGEVWGIAIGLHPSWLLVFGLVTWTLAAGYFPAERPEWSVTTSWILAALTSLVFFASILVHELGHSRVALGNGLPIRSITLFVFGGVARIGREPASPEVELRIAIAGPLTSLALGAAFGGLWLLTGEVGVVAAPALWLARINVTVALFNLLPAFPLDGGRVFRAAVWRWTGSFERASRIAGFAGELVASGFIALGIVTILGGHVLGGLWMTLIGWFLQSAATASRAQAMLRQFLGGATVVQVMTRECPRVERAWTLEKLVHEEVLGAGRRCFFVVRDGALDGLLTLHEVKAVPRERWGETSVGDVVTPADRLTVVRPDESLVAALEKMDDAGVAQMPVVAGGELVGMIGREQILHYVRTRAELGV